jgi:aspartate 1-decarboxylase
VNPLRSWVSGKIHGIRVTGASVEYHGSVTIDEALMMMAGIDIGEQVHVVNLNNGQRWVTYALPGGSGVFTLNGGSARLGVEGDQCVIMTFALSEVPVGAPVLFLDEANQVKDRTRYPR